MKPTKSKLLTVNNIAVVAFTLAMSVMLVVNVKSYAHDLGAAHHDVHCADHNS